MLSACKAVVIGKTEAQLGFLKSFANKCGFALVEEPATGDIPSPETMISYVLVHHKVGDEVLGAITRAIRGGGKDVCFSPIVVIADDCTFEKIAHFVQLGVDDVITLPEKRDVLVQRLCAQLWSEHLYVETENYFGPDRRRLETGSHVDPRRVGMTSYARFIIQRIPERGTKIVRHQIFTAPQATPAMHRVG
jgi:hypothetical protein